MNKYLKQFLLRGLMFGGFGPIVLGIIYAIIEPKGSFSLSGTQILLGIISTYLLAFVQAGASVLNQIEHWPITKSLLCHFSLLFAAYTFFYIANSWIPFKIEVIGIFALIFVVVYFAVWGIVYLSVRGNARKLNKSL